MDEAFIIGLVCSFAFAGGTFVGSLSGYDDGVAKTRDKVIVHCIENPKLCKEEYDYLKNQTRLNEYKRPEIK